MECWRGTLVLIGFTYEGQEHARNKIVALGPAVAAEVVLLRGNRQSPSHPMNQASRQQVQFAEVEDCGNLKN